MLSQEEIDEHMRLAQDEDAPHNKQLVAALIKDLEECEQRIIARHAEIMLHGINFGPETEGKIDMRVGGDGFTIFMNMLIEFFEANGGKNYLTFTVNSRDHGPFKGAHLEVTIRNCDGVLTPGEHIGKLKDINLKLAKTCGCLEPDEYGRPCCKPPCIACQALADAHKTTKTGVPSESPKTL